MRCWCYRYQNFSTLHVSFTECLKKHWDVKPWSALAPAPSGGPSMQVHKASTSHSECHITTMPIFCQQKTCSLSSWFYHHLQCWYCETLPARSCVSHLLYSLWALHKELTPSTQFWTLYHCTQTCSHSWKPLHWRFSSHWSTMWPIHGICHHLFLYQCHVRLVHILPWDHDQEGPEIFHCQQHECTPEIWGRCLGEERVIMCVMMIGQAWQFWPYKWDEPWTLFHHGVCSSSLWGVYSLSQWNILKSINKEIF